jgi:hypothetical protein
VLQEASLKSAPAIKSRYIPKKAKKIVAARILITNDPFSLEAKIRQEDSSKKLREVTKCSKKETSSRRKTHLVQTGITACKLVIVKTT